MGGRLFRQSTSPRLRHTVTNYQYRYGGTAMDVIRALYAEGGPRRFYRGHHQMIRELLGFKRWNLCSLLDASFVRHSARFAAVCDIAVWCLGTKKKRSNFVPFCCCPYGCGGICMHFCGCQNCAYLLLGYLTYDTYLNTAMLFCRTNHSINHKSICIYRVGKPQDTANILKS